MFGMFFVIIPHMLFIVWVNEKLIGLYSKSVCYKLNILKRYAAFSTL